MRGVMMVVLLQPLLRCVAAFLAPCGGRRRGGCSASAPRGFGGSFKGLGSLPVVPPGKPGQVKALPPDGFAPGGPAVFNLASGAVLLGVPGLPFGPEEIRPAKAKIQSARRDRGLPRSRWRNACGELIEAFSPQKPFSTAQSRSNWRSRASFRRSIPSVTPRHPPRRNHSLQLWLQIIAPMV